jgi:methyl-accepting chemotaxis protein
MKNFKISTRLIAGFGILILFILAQSIVSVIGVRSIRTQNQVVENADEIIILMDALRQQEKNYIIRGDELFANDTETTLTKFNNNYEALQLVIQETQSMVTLQENKDTLATMSTNVDNYYDAFYIQYTNLEKNKVSQQELLLQQEKSILFMAESLLEDQNNKLVTEIKANSSANQVEDRLEKISDTVSILQNLLQVNKNIKTYFLTNEEKSKTQILNQIIDIREQLESLKIKLTDRTNIDQINSILSSLTVYEEAFNNYVEAAENQISKELQFIEIARNIQKEASIVAENANTLADQTTNKNNIINMILGFVSIVIGITGTLLITLSITVPIQKIRHISEELAIGNVDVNFDIHQKDEIGALANAFRQLIEHIKETADHMVALSDGDLTQDVQPKSEKDVLGKANKIMVEKLRKTIESISVNAIDVDLSAQNLAEAANQSGYATTQIATTFQEIAKSTQKQTESVTQASTNIEQMVQTIDGVAKGAQEQASAVGKSSTVTALLSNTIERVSNNAAAVSQGAAQASLAATEGSKTMEKTINGMQRIKEKVDISAQKVQDMGERSAEISTILKTIDEIASQTNLLALNAAIEAARAGEHGKGFAVVADEVRKLAERSSSATQEIGSLITNIQETVNQAVAAMDEGSAEVNSGVRDAQDAGMALTEILEAVEEVLKQAEMAAQAAEEMNAASQELVESVDIVSSVVEENTAATEEMAASSSEVLNSIENIASISEENSAAVEQVSASAEEMTAQVEEVSASAQELRDMSQKFLEVVSQFKMSNSMQQIESFKQAHRKWVADLNAMISGRKHIEESAAIDHTECLLGKWMIQQEGSDISKHQSFIDIVEPHKTMHQHCGKVIREFHSGNISQAKAHMSDLEKYSNEILHHLAELEQELFKEQ